MNSHLPLSIKIAFSKPMCVLIAATVVIPFWILFNFLDQLIFFEPIWIFYLPEDALIGFILNHAHFDFDRHISQHKYIRNKTFWTSN